MMKPLENKINQAEIEALAHVPASHIGKVEHFKETLQFLMQMGAFGRDSKQAIAFNMYGGEGLNKITPAMHDSGKSQSTAGDRRLENLRNGRSSFIEREARYFHDAFRLAVGHEWAEQVSHSEFVRTPIRNTVTKLMRSGLPGPWDSLDPVAALRILNAAQSVSNGKPEIFIHPVSGLRISHQGDGSFDAMARIIEGQELKVGSQLYVIIDNLASGSDFLILEYADSPFSLPRSNEPFQAQIMRHADEKTENGKTRIKVSGERDAPLTIGAEPGGYGYCVISFPKGWDVGDAFGIDLETTPITVQELRELVRLLRKTMLENRAVSISLIDYYVPAS